MFSTQIFYKNARETDENNDGKAKDDWIVGDAKGDNHSDDNDNDGKQQTTSRFAISLHTHKHRILYM